MFAQKKKVMMMRQAAPSGGTPVTGLRWEIGRNLNASGQNTSATYGACTYRIEAAGTQVKRTGLASYDNVAINMFIHEYSADYSGLGTYAWIKRTQVFAGGEPLTLDSRMTYVAFTFAFGSSSGKTMTQAIIDAAFGAEWV